jgi:aldose 1-epimerase
MKQSEIYNIKKTETKNKSSLQIQNKNIGLKAVIDLKEGARLKTLTIDNISLINEDKNLPYAETFASAILFPFANRIENGIYNYKNNAYQLACNEGKRNNAMHGLVYNKPFKVKKIKVKKKSILLSLKYKEKKGTAGFPFQYHLMVTYVFSRKKLKLYLEVQNKSLEIFPFTLGWHPYFNSSDIPSSTLNFKSSEKVCFDDSLITKDVIKKETAMPLQINNHQFDDCFVTTDGKLTFTTPAYKLRLKTSAILKYLQIYNAKNSNKIALEFMSGVSNSFNNKIGLQELKPNDVYNASYVLNINSQ